MSQVPTTEAADEADVLVNELREGRRTRKQAQQVYSRLKAFDANRFVESEIVTEADIAGLCSRIKRRKHADAADLVKLGTAFIQSEKNISAFLKVIGALDVIVKEFTGSVMSQQILAAECLCNMTLGDEFCCTKIASAAGIYLMIYMMESYRSHFGRICLWIIQNIAASGEKALNILMSQDLRINCLDLFYKKCIQDEAIKLLDIIIDAKWNTFDEVEKFQVRKAITYRTKVSFSDPLLLQIFLKTLRDASHPDGQFNGSDAHAEHIIEMLVQTLKTSSYDCDLTYFTARTLVQLCGNNKDYMLCLARFSLLLELSISGLINQAVADPKLFPTMDELMRLASLFYKREYREFACVEDYRQVNLMPEQFVIPKFFEY